MITRNYTNPETIDKNKAESEIKYHGMSFKDFTEEYGERETYKTKDILDYLCQ